MSSSIKLTNSSGKIVTITNPDTTSADVAVDLLNNAYTIATVDDFGTVPVGYTTVIVTDTDRGGIFVWSASGTANDGTVFAGSSGYWIRQYSGAVNVKWFGAKGDGVTDDTVAIQNAINALDTAGVLDGGNKEYIVTTLNISSNMTIQNFRLKTKAGAVDFVSPITIGGNNDTNTYENIRIYNVQIDGNRQNQTNVGDSGGGEDGGRHGFRIIGHVTNLVIENCSANYCATDGIEFYTGTGTGSAWPRFQYITVKNCQFNWNRRHGGSGESMQYVEFENCVFNNNGQDLNTTSPLNDGNRGARSGENLYGNGFDNETYGVGFQSDSVSWINVTALQNVRAGILYYDVGLANNPNFVITKNLKFLQCNLDNGTIPSEGSYYALQLTPYSSNHTLGKYYENVTFSDCYINGLLGLIAINNCSVSGSKIIGHAPYAGTIVYSDNIYIDDSLALNGNLFYEDNSTVVYPFRPTDQTRVCQGTQAAITAGSSVDTGISALSTSQAVLRIFNSGASFPGGGAFLVDVYLDGGAGVHVSNGGYNTTQVGTSGSNKLQVVSNGTNWTLKNNDSTSMTISYYKFM